MMREWARQWNEIQVSLSRSRLYFFVSHLHGKRAPTFRYVSQPARLKVACGCACWKSALPRVVYWLVKARGIWKALNISTHWRRPGRQDISLIFSRFHCDFCSSKSWKQGAKPHRCSRGLIYVGWRWPGFINRIEHREVSKIRSCCADQTAQSVRGGTGQQWHANKHKPCQALRIFLSQHQHSKHNPNFVQNELEGGGG